MTVRAGPRRLALRLLPEAWRARATLEVAGRLIEGSARWGYAARALVYISVGAVALLAAAGVTPRAKGTLESLEAWGSWPAGALLLWVTGLGLYAFAGWRALQAVFDADRLGTSPMALAARIGKGFSGLVHGAIAVAVFGLLDAIEDLGEADDRDATREAIAAALDWPGGELVVTVAGACVLVVGLATSGRALTRGFTRDLVCDREMARWAGVLARVGYLARGGVLAGSGALIVLAGLHAKASEARGVGGALEILKDQPGGRVLLAFMGLGLVAFAAFSLLKAGWRRIGR